MNATPVPPSVSPTPIAREGHDLATVCVLCSHNCGLRVDVHEGRIVEIRGDASSPITHGYLCNKAFSIDHYVNHAQRLREPLRRRADGSFEPVSWDEAIAAIAARLGEIRRQHGPRSIGLVGVGGQGNHMDAPYALGWLRALGSKRWFNAFAQEKTQHALLDQWMFDASPSTMLHPDVNRSRYLLVLGTNPRISNRGHNPTETFKWYAEQEDRTMVVVDPRETETTRGADRHVRLRPGTDAFYLLAVAATIVSRGLVDETALRVRSLGLDELREALAAVDVGEMASRCGIAVEDVEAVAEGFAGAESAAIFVDLGVEQTPFSTLVSYLIRVILVLTDNLGRPGGDVFYESLLPPVKEPGRKRAMERALASGIPAIAALGNFGMFSPTLVPEEVLLDHPERLRAIVVEGSNPLLSFSDTAKWREARERLDLLVVIEPTMTETAMLADYVLPTPVGYEKWEMANFPKGFPEVFVQVRPPVVAGPSEALPEPEIYARLAEAMGIVGAPPEELVALAAEAATPEGAMAFFAKGQELAMAEDSRTAKERLLFWAYRAVGRTLPSPALAAIWLQCHLNALLRTESVRRTLGEEWRERNPFEIGTELFRRILDHPEGVEIARAEDEGNLEANVGFEDGKIRLVPEEMLPEIARAIATPPTTDPVYPFVLAAGLRTRWTANTIQRDPKWRKGRGPHCPIALSPADAERLAVRDGDPVRVSTPRGSLVLPAQRDAKLLPGHVWMPNGFGNLWGTDGRLEAVGGNQNELTDVADRDPFTGIPHHRFVRCRLEKAA